MSYIFEKRLQVYRKAWISYEKMATKLFVFHGKSGFSIVYAEFFIETYLIHVDLHFSW